MQDGLAVIYKGHALTGAELYGLAGAALKLTLARLTVARRDQLARADRAWSVLE